jgi:hypothetical protein
MPPSNLIAATFGSLAIAWARFSLPPPANLGLMVFGAAASESGTCLTLKRDHTGLVTYPS